MVDKLSNFGITLVIVIIFLTLIEILLPDNKNKKYVTFTCGVLLILVIINPIIKILNSDINIDSILTDNQIEFSTINYNTDKSYYNEKQITEVYEENLKNDLKENLESNGYKVYGIELKIDNNTYEPQKIDLNIQKKSNGIEPVIIDTSNNLNDKLSQVEKEEIRKLLNDIYKVSKDEIYINN